MASRSRAGALTPDPGDAGSDPAGAGRDRDGAGRPRNARPRDGLGRPLERGAAGEPVTPDDLRLAPEQAVRRAQRLIDDGQPFHAHEVLESVWKAAPADQRDLWQGLAQVAVGLTHARRGNARGAVTLLRRGAAAVSSYLAVASTTGPAGASTTGPAAWVPAAADLAGARQAALALADRIGGEGLGSLVEHDLCVRLTAAP